MSVEDYREFKKRVEDLKVNVFPPYFHEKFVYHKPKITMKRGIYARTRQLDWTGGYLAGMKKAKKLLEKQEEKSKEE